MKFRLPLAAAFVCFLSGCDLEPRNHTEELQKMEDTLFKAFPSVNRVSIEVKNDFGSELLITLGDATLYNASEEARKNVVNEAATIAHYIFSDKLPSKGKVHFVAEENTLIVDKASYKTYDMPLKELKP